MAKGDEVLFYHSVSEKAVVGICSVKRTAYADPTAKEGDWSAVDLVPKNALKRPVTLEEIRGHKKLADMALLRLSRLSVQPVTAAQFAEVVRLGGGAIPLRLSMR
jgi:predicted RNA-binding protein with PUA-like domain